MKKKRSDCLLYPVKWKKIILVMKLTCVLTLWITFSVTASVYSQNDRVTLEAKASTLSSVLMQIKDQTGIRILYNENRLQGVTCHDLNLNNVEVEQALKAILMNTNFWYSLVEGVIVITERPQAQQQRDYTLKGKVVDEKGAPLPGVTVVLKGTTVGTATDPKGEFTLKLPEGNHVLQFSFIGFQSQERSVSKEETLNIVLREAIEELEDVVVTGIFTRRAESFTGASQNFTREQLRQVGNQNLIQSLKNLDPSFNIMENLVDGSNPNVMPEIQLRGQAGLPDIRGDYATNPNQPLFILDGFETTVATVMDLDMNRVESVTLLKDAAAKAIYGAKAANGVVVIETIRPKMGKLQVSYSGSLDVQAPDLTSYNLTNAREQLELEWIIREGTYAAYPVSERNNRLTYNRLLEEVLSGVDTYWLSRPLRVGYGSKHGITLGGGEHNMAYNVDLSYSNQIGVMKGSNRNTASAAVNLAWRYKNISFRNAFTITYNVAKNSPYGSFNEFARMMPYLRPHDEEGNITKILPGWDRTRPNPMWNGTINTLDQSEYMQFRDNFYLEWSPVEGLKLTGRASIAREYQKSELFLPSSHTKFANYTSADLIMRRGEYTYGDGTSFNLSGDIIASYSRKFDRHFLSANFNWNMENINQRNVSFIAEGFPNDYLEDITFARQYMQDSRPTGTEFTTRNIGILGALNYSYDDRYLFDASLRMSGSSQFGSDNRWGTFWSLGLGWNLHNEPFMEDVHFVDMLKVRGSMGYTGSQNFNSYQSKATYTYGTTEMYKNGFGAFLMGIENPELRWQRKYDQNIGVDMGLFHNRLSARFDYYVANTDDLLTEVTIPSSAGFRTYKTNLGEVQNKGYEASIRYRVWNDAQKGNFVNLYLAASHNSNKVRKISNSLATYNEEQANEVHSRPFVRYTEGQSMSAIWAVPSYGIDPSSGQDILVRPDGTTTFTWHSDYLAVCGDTEPTLRGNGGFNIDYEGFSLNVTLSWRFGGQIYNQTLVDKVDAPNITASNSDRRVFTDRWRVPGDMTRFKNVADYSTTRATERFVEDQDELTLSALSLSYDLNRALPVEKIGMTRLRASFNMNDVARLSTVKLERGTSYPFARAFSFSLQAMF